MNSILEQLQENALERTRSLPDADFLLRGLWRVDYRCRPNDRERLMAYGFIIAQTAHQGCCYTEFGMAPIEDVSEPYIGVDARTMPYRNLFQRIAVLDAIYGSLRGPADLSLTVTGTPAEKSVRRATLVVNEVLRELEGIGGRVVANIGVIGNFIYMLRAQGINVKASDFDERLIGKQLNGITIASGTNTLNFVADSDVALVCSETLASETLDEIIKVAADNHTKLVIFAVSGCHFAEEYVRSFGLDVVVSEPQPQYLFQGTSHIRIYRRRPLSCRSSPTKLNILAVVSKQHRRDRDYRRSSVRLAVCL